MNIFNIRPGWEGQKRVLVGAKLENLPLLLGSQLPPLRNAATGLAGGADRRFGDTPA